VKGGYRFLKVKRDPGTAFRLRGFIRSSQASRGIGNGVISPLLIGSGVEVFVMYKDGNFHFALTLTAMPVIDDPISIW
jgi:hypothetical protein